MLASLMGREPTLDECAVYNYKWLSWFDPDHLTGWGYDCGKCTVIPTPPVPSTVPLPASFLLLLVALIALPFMVGLGGLKVLENLDETD